MDLDAAVLRVGYLTAGWATTGRTGGTAVLGLRVLSISRARLGWGRALLRAVLCVVFPVGLLWSGASRERRSLQDAAGPLGRRLRLAARTRLTGTGVIRSR